MSHDCTTTATASSAAIAFPYPAGAYPTVDEGNRNNCGRGGDTTRYARARKTRGIVKRTRSFYRKINPFKSSEARHDYISRHFSSPRVPRPRENQHGLETRSRSLSLFLSFLRESSRPANVYNLLAERANLAAISGPGREIRARCSGQIIRPLAPPPNWVNFLQDLSWRLRETRDVRRRQGETFTGGLLHDSSSSIQLNRVLFFFCARTVFPR